MSNVTATTDECDLLVVGGGVAGFYAALCAANGGRRRRADEGALVASTASYFAQGGVAAAVGPDDDPALHAEDTIARRAVGSAARAPSAVSTERGARARSPTSSISASSSTTTSGREGGHSRAASSHAGGAGDRTGNRARARRTRPRPSADLGRRGRGVIELWSTVDSRCVGRDDGPAVRSPARATLLATGGAAGALGADDESVRARSATGIALAYRAGAAVADLEFIQFHPTALARLRRPPQRGSARRGRAPARRRRRDRFTDELAPRDVVARAIADARHGAARPAPGRPATASPA